MKSSQTFVLGPGTVTLPNGEVYPCSELVITQERAEMVNELGRITHLGPPTVNIELKNPNGPERQTP